MPHKSSVPLYWRLKDSKYKLVGTKCESCDKAYFPPRKLCPECRSKGKMIPFRMSGKGTIESYTIIRVAPEGFEQQAPYAIAIIKLDEGPMLSAQVVDRIEEVEIGKKVRPVFRRMYTDEHGGLIHYGIKFELDA